MGEKTELIKPLTKSEIQLMHFRWFYTLMVPLMALSSWSQYLEHPHRLWWMLAGLNALSFSLISVKAWRLRRHFNQTQSQA